MSETASSQTSIQIKKREAITSDFLKIELTRIFSKVEIEKSKYYAYRMNKYLEIPLDAVYKDPTVSQLTQNKAIINEKEIKRITKNEATYIIALETRESVQAVKDKLLQQGIKAFDEKEKFYYDLIENVEKKKQQNQKQNVKLIRSIPTISDRTLLKSKPKESFIGYHRGILQGYLNQSIPPVSPSTQYLNHLQFLQIMDPTFLRMNNVVDALTYPQSSNPQRKKNNKTETPKISAATPSYRRKRLLSQQQFQQDQNDIQDQNKIQECHPSLNEEIIYEKKKSTQNYQLQMMRSPKQVQFKEQNLQVKQKKLIQKVSSTSQFERADNDQSDHQSNESFEINKRNQHKLKASKSSESFKDTLLFGELTTDDKRESLLSEDANSTSTQQVDMSECNFTPKITLLQMEVNQNQEDSESEHDDDELNNKEKFHPQTTDSFRPKNYQKLEQIDDLEI